MSSPGRKRRTTELGQLNDLFQLCPTLTFCRICTIFSRRVWRTTESTMFAEVWWGSTFLFVRIIWIHTIVVLLPSCVVWCFCWEDGNLFWSIIWFPSNKGFIWQVSLFTSCVNNANPRVIINNIPSHHPTSNHVQVPSQQQQRHDDHEDDWL